MRAAPAFLLLSSALWAAACAGPRATAPPPDEAPATPTYETFDPEMYQVPVRATADVQHDVPDRLMEGRVDLPRQEAQTPEAPRAPQPRQVDGFRVQVFSSDDRAAAERVRAQAEEWGANRAMEATITYIRPYYRVRMGGFATRADAEAALENVRNRFPEAFLVPDLVTVFE